MMTQRTWLFGVLAALVAACTVSCGGDPDDGSSGTGGQGGSSKVCVVGKSKIGACTLAP
ncbi:MAG: hypothetical protein QM820_21945 [Minicystis sp.]